MLLPSTGRHPQEHQSRYDRKGTNEQERQLAHKAERQQARKTDVGALVRTYLHRVHTESTDSPQKIPHIAGRLGSKTDVRVYSEPIFMAQVHAGIGRWAGVNPSKTVEEM